MRAVRGHVADRLFFSVEGLTEQRVMADADSLEAEVERAMIAHGMSAEEAAPLRAAGARVQVLDG